MTALTAGVSATDEVWSIDAPIPTSVKYLRVEDEIVAVGAWDQAQDALGPTALKIRVRRGASGTAASHESGTTLTAFYPQYGAAAVDTGGGGSEPVEIIRTDGTGDSLAVTDQSAVEVFSVGAGGEVVIAPNADNTNSLVSLAVHSQDSAGAFPLEIYDRDGTRQWYIDSSGALDMAVGGGVILPAEGAMFLFNHDLVPLEIKRNVGDTNTVPFVDVYIGTQHVFRIDADGSVHIKTGTSIVADL